MRERRRFGLARRLPEMREALKLVLAREGAGLAHLEIEGARDGALAERCAVSARETLRHMNALREVLELLDYLEAGGS